MKPCSQCSEKPGKTGFSGSNSGFSCQIFLRKPCFARFFGFTRNTSPTPTVVAEDELNLRPLPPLGLLLLEEEGGEPGDAAAAAADVIAAAVATGRGRGAAVLRPKHCPSTADVSGILELGNVLALYS